LCQSRRRLDLPLTRPALIWYCQITSTPAFLLLHSRSSSCAGHACLLILCLSAGTVLVHPSKVAFQRGCVHQHCYTTSQLAVTNVELKRTNVSEGQASKYSYKEIPGAAVNDLARMSRYVPTPGSCLALYIVFRRPPQCYLRRIPFRDRRGLIHGHDRSLTTI
jgi:hypothetical protein